MASNIEEIIREKTNITRKSKRQLLRSRTYFEKHLDKCLTEYHQKISKLSKKFDNRVKEIAFIHEQLLTGLISNYDETILKKETNSHKRTVLYPAIRKKIIEEVCYYFNQPIEEIINDNKRGDRVTTECRSTICYFFVENGLGTTKEMANEVRRERKIVFRGVELVKNLLDTDKYYRQNFTNISERINEIIESFLTCEQKK